jgi:hypothetical protein
VACVARGDSSTRLAAGATSSCDPGKGGICVVFDGLIKGSKKSPRLFATSVSATIHWHLVWVTSGQGYGVPDLLEKSSTVGGKATVMLQAKPTRCVTSFELSPTNLPTLAQGSANKGDLMIKVPNPADVSAGSGTGYPSIRVTNADCAAGLLSTNPVIYRVEVPLHPITTSRHVIGVGTYNIPTQGTTGAGRMRGTITVTVG